MKLGFFTRRDFPLAAISLDRQSQSRLSQMVSGGVFTNNWRIMRIYPDERFARVTACPGDMKVIEQIISEFQKAEAAEGANPDGPGRGHQERR